MDWSQLVLKILSTGILFIILAVICLLLVIHIQRSLTIENKREHSIKLSNQGNFASVFSLSVVSVEKIFSFKFLINNIPLVPVSQADMSQSLLVDPTPSSNVDVQNKVHGKVGNRTETITDKKTTDNKDGIRKSGQAVAGKAGLVASLISTLASLLPGTLGSNLRARSEVLRETQANIQTAAQAPGDAQRKVASLQQQSGKLSGSKPEAAPGISSRGRQAEVHSTPPSAVNSTAERPSSIAVQKIVSDVYRVQTQAVDPGADLSLILRIEASKQSRPDGTFAYTLSSQQLPLDALDGVLPPVTRQGILHFSHIDIWRYWLAPIGSFLVSASLLFIFILMLRFIWY